MSEAAESADLAPPERLHPLIVLTGLGGSLRGVIGGYAGIGYLAATGNLKTALFAAGVLLIGLLVSLVLYWRRFEYRVGAHEIRIDTGILSRTHRSIPFDRVQDVDISQGPLARVLRLAKVKFETGGSAGSDEAVLPAIALHRAQALRDHVRSRRGLQSGAVSRSEAHEEPHPIFFMSLRRVLTAGVFNFSLALFAGLFGVTQTAGDLIGFDPFERAFWERTLNSAGPASEFLQSHRLGAVAAGLLLLLILGLATGIARTLTRDFRFRLDRTGTGLRRRRGLLTLTDVTIPVRRVQAALILTGPVREYFGWFELKLQSLARDEEGGGGDHVVAPLARQDELAAILSQLDWRLPEQSDAWEGISKAYLWTLLAGLTPLFALTGALLAALGLLPVFLHERLQAPVATSLAPAFLSLALLCTAMLAVVAARWLAWRRTAFSLRKDALLVRTGWWRRRTLLLPLKSVQSIDLLENALTRRFGVARLTIGVAGGRGFAGHTIPALPRERASQLREALLSRFP